jgi:hypothetical protein
MIVSKSSGVDSADQQSVVNSMTFDYERETGQPDMDRRTPISSREAKIRWLLAHQSLWEGFNPNDRQNWRDIIRLMKADGLIANSTYALDVGLLSLIADAHSH